MLSWDDFLAKVADKHSLFDEDDRQAFLKKFAQESPGRSKLDAQVAIDLNISEVTLQRRLGNVYEAFSQSCPDLKSKKKGKFQILRDWLKGGYRDYQENGRLPWLIEIPREVNQEVRLPPPTIDWHEICGKVLAIQQETQRLRRQATERGFELNVYVPLGLVERKQQQRRTGDVSLDKVYELDREVITKEYDNHQFLKQVIESGKSRRIAIIGEPGAGKTTLLDKVAGWIQENNFGLPICLPLGGLQGKTIPEYLHQNWVKDCSPLLAGEELRERLQQLFREGKVWLLLDGVDEMAASSPIEALAKIKDQLFDWVGEARVILTCRLNVWDTNINNILTGFEIYRTLEFKPKQVEEFIRDWFAQAQKQEPETPFLGERGFLLISKLNETGRDRIRQLVRNPLRLSLLCQTFYLSSDNELPETKAELYERFTRYFYEWKSEQYLLTEQDDVIDELHAALANLALTGISSAARFRLPRKLARKEMGEKLFNLACRLGWLNLVDREAKNDEAVYAFYHPTFQEYFAATAIDNWDYFLPREHKDKSVKDHSGEYKPYRIFEPQWKEVILLWLGRENVIQQQKEEFIKALVGLNNAIEPPFYQYRAIFLAAAGIAEFTDSSWADQIVTNVVTLSFGIFDNDQKTWRLPLEPLAQVAKFALLETERTKAIKILLDLITQCNQCQQENVYFQVLAILKQISNENSDVIDFLEKELSQSNIQSLALRQMIAEALGHISGGNKTAILTITKMIKNSSDSFSIQILCNKLETIGKNNVLCISVLEEMLEDCSKSKEFKRIVGTALWNINHGNQKAVAVLVDLVKDTHYYDRFRVFEVISKIIDDTINEEIVSALTDIVRDNDEKDEIAKILAFKILLLIPDVNKNVFDDFINLFQGKTKNYIHHEILKIIDRLNCINHKKTVEVFIKFIKSDNDNLRLISAFNLGKLEKYKTITINTLEDLISNAKDELLRCEAAYFLAQNDKDNRVALETLNKFAKDRSDDNCRERAAIYLIKLFPSNEIAIKALEELATNCQNEQIRRIAAINLGYYQPKNSIPINCLFCLSKNSQHELIRGMTTENLGNLGLITPLKPEVINALVELLTSSESGIVCKNAADALKNMVNSEEQKSVIVALKNYLSEQTYINDFGRFYYCYDIVWHCAQNLSYPDFYQAWHQDTLIFEKVETYGDDR